MIVWGIIGASVVLIAAGLLRLREQVRRIEWVHITTGGEPACLRCGDRGWYWDSFASPGCVIRGVCGACAEDPA